MDYKVYERDAFTIIDVFSKFGGVISGFVALIGIIGIILIMIISNRF